MPVEILEAKPMRARRSFSRMALCSVKHLRRAFVATIAASEFHGCSTHNLPSSTDILGLEDPSLLSQDSTVSL